uniref:Uncharacterized protein n=1 Tax=Picea glauca TaxID=3330 RepID=A0A101M1J0_PICGL|nr:hypothetical protein ABT39_MTgene3751 [Picea glauca]
MLQVSNSSSHELYMSFRLQILTSDTNLMGKHPEIEMAIHPVTPGETSLS